MDFLPPPNSCPDNTYNLYHGLRAESLTCNFSDIDLHLILDLHSKLCGNDAAFIEYSLNWHANLVQQPGKLSRVGLLLQSIEGCGKTLWLDWIGLKILGPDYYFSSTNIEDVFGTFAPGLKHKLLVNVNEVDAAGAQKYVERIKASITDDSITFQAKNVMTVSLKNYARFVLTTNNRNVIEASSSDRRFAAVECDSSRCNDHDYFSQITPLLEDDRYTKAFFEFLRARDISEWIPSKRPMTKLYKQMKELSIPILSLWLIDLIQDQTQIKRVLATRLLQIYKDWREEHQFPVTCQQTEPRTFGNDIRYYNGVAWKPAKRGIEYSFNNQTIEAWLVQHNHWIKEVEFVDDE